MACRCNGRLRTDPVSGGYRAGAVQQRGKLALQAAGADVEDAQRQPELRGDRGRAAVQVSVPLLR
jgi:hypothetical protein